jgi:hypothetical protein
LITTFENVAVPEDAATVCGKLPDGFVALPVIGLNAVDNVTFALLVVALPNASWIATVMAGEFAAPLTTLLGCCVKTTFDGVAGVTVIVGSGLVRVYVPVPASPPIKPLAVDAHV